MSQEGGLAVLRVSPKLFEFRWSRSFGRYLRHLKSDLGFHARNSGTRMDSARCRVRGFRVPASGGKETMQ